MWETLTKALCFIMWYCAFSLLKRAGCGLQFDLFAINIYPINNMMYNFLCFLQYQFKPVLFVYMSMGPLQKETATYMCMKATGINKLLCFLVNSSKLWCLEVLWGHKWSLVARYQIYTGKVWIHKAYTLFQTKFRFWPMRETYRSYSPQEIPMNKTLLSLVHLQGSKNIQWSNGGALLKINSHTFHLVPDLLQTEHAQSGVVFRSFLVRKTALWGK